LKENSPTILVCGWNPTVEGTISSEKSSYELERLVSWRSTRSYRLQERKEQEFGRRGHLSSIEERGRNHRSSIRMVRTRWESWWGLEWSVWEEIGRRVFALEWLILNEGGWLRKWALEHERWGDTSRQQTEQGYMGFVGQTGAGPGLGWILPLTSRSEYK